MSKTCAYLYSLSLPPHRLLQVRDWPGGCHSPLSLGMANKPTGSTLCLLGWSQTLIGETALVSSLAARWSCLKMCPRPLGTGRWNITGWTQPSVRKEKKKTKTNNKSCLLQQQLPVWTCCSMLIASWTRSACHVVLTTSTSLRPGTAGLNRVSPGRWQTQTKAPL